MEKENLNNSKKDIEELYLAIESVAKMNPQLYIIPTELYNNIISKFSYIESELVRVKKGRDNWRNKYYELKNEKR